MSAAMQPVPMPTTAEDRILAHLALLAEDLRVLIEERQARRAAEATRPETLYTPRQAAALLHDSQRTVTEWCKRGVIRAERHGRRAARWKIPLSEIERMRTTFRRRGLQPVA